VVVSLARVQATHLPGELMLALRDTARMLDLEPVVCWRRFGGRYVVRGAPCETLEGAWSPSRFVVLEFPDKDCTLVMLRPGMFEPVAAGTQPTATRDVQLALDGVAATEHLGFEEVQETDVDITKAPFLVSIGRGVEDKDELPRFEALAERFGATLSVSRPLVDAGWMPSARQVGQSGKTVKPRVYLALGISGAVQHLAGMRTADTIIAVNTDPEAPIFGVAHYGAVADLFDVADELEQALE